MTKQTIARYAPWAVTALLLAMALGSMVIWTRNIGIQEDWNMIDAWLGHQPDLPGWLWSQNNEHRLPVGRLIYLLALWATDDFRSGMVISQLLLAGLSLLLIRLAVHLRGGEYRLSDILFPLSLLHLGHWENLLWGWQIQFVSSAFLCGLLLLAISYGPRPGFKSAVMAGVAMSLLPMTGANGIAIGVGLAPWALIAAFLMRREDRWRALALLLGALLAIGGTLLYFRGYISPLWSPPPANPFQFYFASKAYFAMATGRWSASLSLPTALMVLAILGVGSLFALAASLRKPLLSDLRGLGLCGFILCNILLGLIIAYSRGSYPYELPARYAIFAVMPLLAAIIAITIYAPRPLARWIPNFMAILFVLLLPLNIREGFTWRNWYVAGMTKFEADVAAGLPLADIAERNTAFLLHSCDGCLIRHLRDLRAAGIEPFDSLPPPRHPDDQAGRQPEAKHETDLNTR